MENDLASPLRMAKIPGVKMKKPPARNSPWIMIQLKPGLGVEILLADTSGVASFPCSKKLDFIFNL